MDTFENLPWYTLEKGTRRKTDKIATHEAFWEVLHTGRHSLFIRFNTPISKRLIIEFKGATATFGKTDENICFFRFELHKVIDDNLFYPLCVDLLKLLFLQGNHLADAIEKRLRQWKNFLSQENIDTIERSKQLGLFGELKFIQFLYEEKKLSFNEILSGWKGPEKASKDFIFTFGEFEVKSHERNYVISISNEYQLDSGTAPLFLVSFSVCDNTFGESIKTLSDNLISLIQNEYPELRVEFESKLFEYGYNSSVIYKNLYFFGINEMLFYSVNENFPAIVRKKLLPSIHQVSYNLDLTLLSEFITNPPR